MTVGIYHVEAQTKVSDDAYLCARATVKSVRKAMPGVPVVHFTDMVSPPIKGVDAVRRKPSEPMACLRMRHHAGVEGDWLFVDTDVVIQRDVRRVFREPFDIAVTTRNWKHLRAAVGFTERMPFNSGVVFSRCPHFWGEVYTRLRVLEADQQQWMGDQEIFCEVIAEGRYSVKKVKGSEYNFPPEVPDPDAIPASVLQEQAAIVHYKGPKRKALLLARLRGEARVCA